MAPRRASVDDSIVHDGRGALLSAARSRPSASHPCGDVAGVEGPGPSSASTASEHRLLAADTALTCPWTQKRHSRRVSHHGDASCPLLSPEDEAAFRASLEAARLGRRPAVVGAKGGSTKSAGGTAAVVAIAEDGASTCVITASGGWPGDALTMQAAPQQQELC